MHQTSHSHTNYFETNRYTKPILPQHENKITPNIQYIYFCKPFTTYDSKMLNRITKNKTTSHFRFHSTHDFHIKIAINLRIGGLHLTSCKTLASIKQI